MLNIYGFVNRLRLFLFQTKYRKIVSCDALSVKNTVVINKGSDNQIIIKDQSRLKDCQFYFSGCNNTIIIENSVELNGVSFWLEDDNNQIIVGCGTTIQENTQLAACEGTKIEIGNDCMFSHSILVRTTDSHSIIDENHVRINKAEDIQIGNHVWVGLQSLILKGVHVPDNSIIGARSIVSSSHELEPNSVIVGSPATVVKRNITWLRDRI